MLSADDLASPPVHSDEERDARLWFLEGLERVTSAIRPRSEPEEVMADVLDAAAAVLGCDRAILASPTEAGALRVEAMRGTEDDGVSTEAISALLREMAGAAEGDGPAAFGADGDAPHLPRESFEAAGVRAALWMRVVPALDEPHPGYHLALFRSADRAAWREIEVRLFGEVGRRLGDALTTRLMLRALRQSEARLQEAQRVAHVGYWERYLDSDRYYFSDETYRIIGLRPQEYPMTPARYQEFIHPEDRANRDRVVDELHAGAARVGVEYRLVRPDGEVRIVHVQGSSLRDEAGRVRRTFGTVQDVTEQRRAEEALRRAQAELARITRTMTVAEIGASIAHEVNQPLAGIVMNANAALHWLAASPPELDEARAALANVIGDGERAGRIVGRIRTLLRGEEPEARPVALDDLVRETVVLVRTELARHHVAVRTELDAALPRPTGDRVQLQQVLVNLVLNARDAMDAVPADARVLRIRVRRAADGGEDGVVVEVEDTGRGLGPGHPDRIFEAFYSTRPGGLGMGLAISRSIVEAHRGRLWAAPNDGPGATLRFWLPLDGEDGR